MFKVLEKECEPQRGSKYSACVDLFASEDVVIGAGETKLVGLGVCIDLDVIALKRHNATHQDIINSVNNEPVKLKWEFFLKSHYLQLMLRSSLGKKGLMLANGVGVIDLDYPDEIKMIIHNPIKSGFLFRIVQMAKYIKQDLFNMEIHSNLHEIKKGDKIGQITLLEHKGYLMNIESDAERTGGFGSTDKKDGKDV